MHRDDWVVYLVGAIILAIYGVIRFNSPKYRIKPTEENKTDPKAVALEEIHISVPPKFASRRRSYSLYRIIYICVVEGIFAIWTLYPEAFASLDPPAINEPSERVAWGLFILMGILPNFQAIRDLEQKLIGWAHKRALIPHAVRLDADILYETEYAPAWLDGGEAPPEDVLIGRLNGAQAYRCAKEFENAYGALETSWAKVASLYSKIMQLRQKKEHQRTAIALEEVINAFQKNYSRRKSQLIEYYEEEMSVVDSKVENVDDYIVRRSSIADENGKERVNRLYKERGRLLIHTEALRYQACLLVSLLMFAASKKEEQIAEQYEKLGFNYPRPEMPANLPYLVFTTSIVIAGVLFVTLLVYLLLIHSVYVDLIENNQEYSHIKVDPRRVAPQSMGLLILHSGAFITALMTKRFLIRRRERDSVQHGGIVAENVIAFGVAYLYSYTAGLLIFGAIRILDGSFSWIVLVSGLLWAFAPAITGYWASVYIDVVKKLVKPSLGIRVRYAAKQGGLTWLVGASALLAFAMQEFDVNEIGKAPNFIYLMYGSLSNGLVGAAIPIVFIKIYFEDRLRRGFKPGNSDKAERVSATAHPVGL